MRQRGIDPNTHQPLSEVEINIDKDKPPCTGDKSNINIHKVASNNEDPSAKTLKLITSMPMECYPLEIPSISNNINNSSSTPTQELFLDRFGTSTTSCRPNSDHIVGGGYFSFQQQLNYGTNNNMGLTECFIPGSTSISSSSQMMSSDVNSNSSTITSTMLHSVSSSSIFPTPNPKHVKQHPSISSSGDVDGVQNWEFSNNASRSNNGSSSSIQLQSSSTNFLDHVPLQQAEQEEIKWSEYLNTPFFLGNNTVQQQQQQQQNQSIYSTDDEVKQPETGFINTTDESSTTWHHHHIHSQQQQHFQPSSADIYTKDLQRFSSLAFGQTTLYSTEPT